MAPPASSPPPARPADQQHGTTAPRPRRPLPAPKRSRCHHAGFVGTVTNVTGSTGRLRRRHRRRPLVRPPVDLFGPWPRVTTAPHSLRGFGGDKSARACLPPAYRIHASRSAGDTRRKELRAEPSRPAPDAGQRPPAPRAAAFAAPRGRAAALLSGGCRVRASDAGGLRALSCSVPGDVGCVFWTRGFFRSDPEPEARCVNVIAPGRRVFDAPAQAGARGLPADGDARPPSASTLARSGRRTGATQCVAPAGSATLPLAEQFNRNRRRAKYLSPNCGTPAGGSVLACDLMW